MTDVEIFNQVEKKKKKKEPVLLLFTYISSKQERKKNRNKNKKNMTDEGPEFDLFAEDATEQFAKEVGVDLSKVEIKNMKEKENEPSPQNSIAEDICVIIASCVTCIATPVDVMISEKLEGRWCSSSGHRIKLQRTQQRRLEATRMGRQSIPVGGVYSDASSKPEIGEYFIDKETSTNTLIISNLTNTLQHHNGWISPKTASNTKIPFIENDHVLIKHNHSNEYIHGVIDAITTANINIRLADGNILSNKECVIKRNHQVTLLGSRVIPYMSTRNKIVWSDGDVWKRDMFKPTCPSTGCGKSLSLLYCLPPPYTNRFWCSYCGCEKIVSKGVHHCDLCFFDSCKNCISRSMRSQRRRNHQTTVPDNVMCSQCNKGPLLVNELSVHWNHYCTHNLFKTPLKAADNRSSKRTIKTEADRYAAAIKRATLLIEKELLPSVRCVAVAAAVAVKGCKISKKNKTHSLKKIERRRLKQALAVEERLSDEEDLADVSSISKTIYSAAYHGSVELMEEVVLSLRKTHTKKAIVNSYGKVQLKQTKTVKGISYKKETGTAVLTTFGQPATPLMFACLNAMYESVIWLLKNGADPSLFIKSTSPDVRFGDAYSIAKLNNFPTFCVVLMAQTLYQSSTFHIKSVLKNCSGMLSIPYYGGDGFPSSSSSLRNFILDNPKKGILAKLTIDLGSAAPTSRPQDKIITIVKPLPKLIKLLQRPDGSCPGEATDVLESLLKKVEKSNIKHMIDE